MSDSIPPIKAVLFDFGGVLAEEGFREGLMAIARSNGPDPLEFFNTAAEEVYATGYVLGRCSEHAYWNVLRARTGIKGTDEEFRREILGHFVLRPWMLELVKHIRRSIPNVSILSDQCNWLDELDGSYDFFRFFDLVINSYHIGKGKMDRSVFADAADMLGLEPSEILFIDDNKGHVERARSMGLHAILYTGREELEARLKEFGISVPA